MTLLIVYVFEKSEVPVLLFVAVTETVPEMRFEVTVRLPVVVTVIPWKLKVPVTGGSVLVTVTVTIVEWESVPS